MDNISSINDWRVDKKTGRDILTFNPTYNGRKLIQDIESFNLHKNDTVLIIKKGVDYLYPGFQKSPTVPVIYSPCCFGNSNMRAKEAFLVSADDDENIKKSNSQVSKYNIFFNGFHCFIGKSTLTEKNQSNDMSKKISI